MTVFLPLSDAIDRYLKPDTLIAFEGFTHLIPFAAAHEAIRSGKKNLTLVRMTPDIVYDQMIGMGLVKKMIFSYAGNPGVGLLRRLRDSVEHGWPNRIEIEEHSHAALANAYDAGASGLPFAVLRGYQGAELKEVNPNIKPINCPFTGENLVAVPAITPDLTVIHAQKADERGNVLVEGIVGVQKQALLAAKKALVTVEEVVSDLDAHPNACLLPFWTVDAISVVPGGAHPSYTHGYYERDNASYLDWDRIAGNRDRFQEWMDANVLQQDSEIFNRRVKHLRC